MIIHNNLEEYRDPINYDLEFGGEVAKYNFYLELAKSVSGEVLELACGTGLTTLPLAQAGINITGVDISHNMIEYAQVKAKGLPVTFIEADARHFQSEKKYSLIYLTGNAFQAFLTDEDQHALLKTVTQHLQTDGLFAFETRNPLGTDLSTESETPWGKFVDANGTIVNVSGIQEYDTNSQIMHWKTIRDWGYKQTTSRIACRFTNNDTLISLLADYNLKVEDQYQDWDKAPFTPLAHSIISLFRKKS
jgi:ubiquinone/menaquinone biosynthesis C-methylase UbiE